MIITVIALTTHYLGLSILHFSSIKEHYTTNCLEHLCQVYACGRVIHMIYLCIYYTMLYNNI